jgi:hypothetical protein
MITIHENWMGCVTFHCNTKQEFEHVSKTYPFKDNKSLNVVQVQKELLDCNFEVTINECED